MTDKISDHDQCKQPKKKLTRENSFSYSVESLHNKSAKSTELSPASKAIDSPKIQAVTQTRNFYLKDLQKIPGVTPQEVANKY